jgi:nitrile hydratase accessory protein
MSGGAPQDVLESVPGAHDAPVFAEPWQARIFAVVSRLCMDGRFPWDDMKRNLITEIGQGGEVDPTEYYVHFLNACERLLTSKGLLGVDELAALRAHLAAHPPHPTTSRPGPVTVDPARSDIG